MELRNRDRDALPFTTLDGSTIREIMRAEAQSLAEASLPAGGATTRHWHALAEELYYVLAGSARMEVDGVVREIGVGDCVLIPPGARHRIEAHTDLRFLCCCAPPYQDADTHFDDTPSG